MSGKAYLSVSADVKAALAAGKAVVALESTIITHGMPYPQNLEMAREVEDVVRATGAVPATIAIMDGRLCVGLAGEDLERLAIE
ncbi:MAG: pseudouridine-5-phosphate glycosidase, partial [Hyphomicrobiales bacterium]